MAIDSGNVSIGKVIDTGEDATDDALSRKRVSNANERNNQGGKNNNNDSGGGAGDNSSNSNDDNKDSKDTNSNNNNQDANSEKQDQNDDDVTDLTKDGDTNEDKGDEKDPDKQADQELEDAVNDTTGDDGKVDDTTKDMKDIGKQAMSKAASSGARGLSNLATGLVGAAKAFAGTVVGATTAVAGTIAGAIGTAISTVGAFLGMGVASSTMIVVGGLALGAVLVGGTIFTAFADNNTAKYDGIVDCTTQVAEAKEQAEVDPSAQQQQNAQKLYSVFKSRGWSDNMIGGMLGNFSVESGIDPTSIEGIFDEHYSITGPKKTYALEHMTEYTKNLLSQYKGGINVAQYQTDDGGYFCGIGVGQWTSGDRLKTPADSTGNQWYSLDFQIAYIIAFGSPSRGTGFEEMYKTHENDSAEDCGYTFADIFEGNTSRGIPERKSSSAEWASQISSWSIDDAYVQTIMQLAQQLGSASWDKNVKQEEDNCKKTQTYDNSTLAKSMVSFAWKDNASSYNDGTELYQKVCGKTNADNPYLKACDHAVHAGVLWSDLDDDFPYIASNQKNYMSSSSRWTKVGDASSVSDDQIQPGDIIVSDNHVCVYVGTELIEKQFSEDAGKGYDTVSASLNERSAACNNDFNWMKSQGAVVFRCSDPMKSGKWVNAGS